MKQLLNLLHSIILTGKEIQILSTTEKVPQRPVKGKKVFSGKFSRSKNGFTKIQDKT